MRWRVTEVHPEYWNRDYNGFGDVWGVRVETTSLPALLKQINTHFWLKPHLNHLKRLKKVSDNTVFVLLGETDEFNDEQSRFLKVCCGENFQIYSIRVPLEPPRTVEECRKLSETWPLTFRKSRVRWTPTPITKLDELDAITLFADKVWSEFCSKKFNCLPAHPCSMVCGLVIGRRCVALTTNTTMIESGAKPTEHAVLKAIDQLAHILVSISVERQGGLPESTLSLKGQYYATEADVYLVGEPCYMCGMALVHSRARRLLLLSDCESSCNGSSREEVSGNGNSNGDERGENSEGEAVCAAKFMRGETSRNDWTGCLLGCERYALQLQRPLNHHYLVYKIERSN
eukprot:Gregarina_sp_Poly_1__10051@NODE_676_length_6827_cov_240_110355_g509_i0_p3_GENE_NODE_676_length_6827_cov_240_110355_g509_i0NODE_676_length_6827_cov_240_110355_g509_i0_p3_ORF_typecomplete_len344_score22_72dCMP_cyt_deam_1/PF00383_23/7_7e09MafB19deam/PF14437_6/1_8e07Prokineticin/PF06607_11/0_45Prokineticin/PF06607_11/1_4e02_NODE_676_length_6827_cov_240_110355_g509_i021713202